MINRNELSIYTKTWMTLKCILPSEVSQSVKVTLYIVTFTHSTKGKTIETDDTSIVIRVWRGEG